MMRLWDVNVSVLLEAHSNEEAMEKVESFLRRDGRIKDLDFNFMMHKVEDAEEESLQALRDRQDSDKGVTDA
ncbi:MAG: hypothetical protein HQ559_04260 [Lentisphaerae bacterium]|nr:hypothetical protein [Lentisphaerota bacterium]